MDRIDLTALFVLFLGIPMAIFLGAIGMLLTALGVVLIGTGR